MRIGAGATLGGLLLICATAHCGSSDSESSGGSGGSTGGTGGAAGASGTGGAAGASGTSGTGGAAGASGTSGTGGAAGAGEDGYTSATCGAIPILGAQWPDITAACASCIEQSCCTEAKACGDDAECLALRTCVDDCDGDSACVDECYVEHDAGSTGSGAFVTCRESTCAPTCADLACVGEVVWDTPANTSYELQLFVSELQSGAYLEGLTVKVCAIADPTCATPLGEETTGADGSVTLTVPSAVEGLGAYFETTGADVIPTLTFISFADNVTVFEAGVLYTTILSTSTANLLTGVMQVTLDPARGHVLFQVKDCSNYAFAGASVSVDQADAQSTTAYIKGSLPSTTEVVTDRSGRGAVMNVPAGDATVEGVIESGAPFAAMPVIIREGYMTNLNVVPTPDG